MLPPRLSRQHVLNLMRLMRQRPRDDARGSGTSLAELLNAAAGTIKRRSLVLVVSDFISQPGWESALSRLAQRHEVVAVRLFDPLEMELPELGLVTVEDAETGEQLFIDTADPAFRQRYAAEAEAARPRCARRWPMPAPTRWSCPPTTTCSKRCCALPRCAASAGGSRSAGAFRPTCAATRRSKLREP